MSKGIDKAAAEIMVSSITSSTLKQYQGALKLWWNFSTTNNISIFNANTSDILRFLTERFNNGASYGTLNSIRSAISLISTQDLGKDKLLSRFFKGVFKERPTRPKYASTWDTTPVLQYIEELYPLNKQKLKDAAEKVSTLLILSTAHRLQTLALIDIKNISISKSKITIKIPDLIKTSKPGKNQPELILPFYKEKPGLCAASAIIDYLKMTKHLRNDQNNKLFISNMKPYKNVTSQTIGHWIKSLLSKAGIDTDQFTAYTTKHAAVSAAIRNGVDVDTIRRTAGWSQRSLTFAKFYNRPIQENNDTFAKAILTSSKAT